VKKNHHLCAVVIGAMAGIAMLCGRSAEASKTLSEVKPAIRFVFLRHGEKPAEGLGQLNCKGLNRALALPDVLLQRFGRPNALYAPSPAYTKADKGKVYNYIRPLATIEPTAIRLGMPVHTEYGFDQVEQLKAALLKEVRYPETKSKRQVWIVWEHKETINTERALFKTLGVNPDLAQDWDADEFDRLDVIDVNMVPSGVAHVTYRKLKEGLTQLPITCPKVSY
jgi:hypothetical protein